MKKATHEIPRDDHAIRPSRRARLQALLFSGATLGTTLLTLSAAIDPKLPPFRNE